MINICGEITYEVVAGDLDVYITYTQETHAIVIYCEDMSLLTTGSFSYTVNVYLTAYPTCNCVGCCGSTTGTIVIVDPCLTCSISAGEPSGLMVTYGAPGTWNFPALTVVPSPCGNEVVYTCTYMGPSMQWDLCNFQYATGAFSSSGSFDSSTGSYTFNSDDMATFPEGTYNFAITASIGGKITSVQFQMKLVSSCPFVGPAITSHPFTGDYTYFLGTDAL
jgi:hypothetical protein